MAGKLGLDHPWFRPVWRRVLVVALCLGWAAFELLGGRWGFQGGSPLFGVLFAALGLYAAYVLFLDYHPASPPPARPGEEPRE